MTITQLSNQITENYRKSRNLHTLVTSTKFQDLFSSTTEEKKQEVISLISKGDIDSINNWIRIESGNYPIMALRTLARRRGIKNYMRLSISQLVGQLVKVGYKEKQLMNIKGTYYEAEKEESSCGTY